MTDAHGVARDQLRAFIERIERLEEEKKTIADDIKDVYGEAKGTGFDTKILRKLISIRKQDREERMEQEAILDMYMIALGMIDGDYADAEPRQSAPVQRQPAMALRSDAGLNIVTKHIEITASTVDAAVTTGDDLREPVAAEQGQIIREGDAPRETDRLGGDASCPDTEFQMDRATEGSFETGSEAAEKGRKATATVAAPADLNHAGAGESPATDQPLTGGDHEVTGIAERDRDIPTSNTGEGTALSALPAKPKFVLRPHCKNPGETCPGHGTTHCRACLKALEEEAA